MTNAYINRLRTALALQQPSGVWTNAFAYDLARRLTNVVSPAGTFLYAYPASSATLHASRLTLPNTAYITNAYDVVARLTGTYLRTGAGVLTNKHEYQYDPAGERTNQTRIDGITVAYTYDNIGQLRTVFANTTPADMWSYGYDAAWNLSRRTNGNNGVFWTAFPVNNLNELTGGGYDANGNQTSYGAYNSLTYSYDDENRLIQIADNVNYSFLTQFTYDGKGRLRIRDEYLSQPDPYYPDQYDWYLASETRYVYDGWRVIQERDQNNYPAIAYTRGTDLSGSLEGAGGIAGLLARSDLGTGTHAYYHADGSGNITMLLDTNQTMVASYRYNDPYGNNVTTSGTLASANVYRFSSKERHAQSGLYYYGYRFYFPYPQRWTNRDPIGEGRALNLYDFVFNDPVSGYDPLGLVCRKGFIWAGRFWGHGGSRILTGILLVERVWTETRNLLPPTTCIDPPPVFQSRTCRQAGTALQRYIVTRQFEYDLCQRGQGVNVETELVFTGSSRTSVPVPVGQPYNVTFTGPVDCGVWSPSPTGTVIAGGP